MHKKTSALVLSIAVHLTFVLVALTFVAVRVYITPEHAFEPVSVERPRMKLRKLQVPVKEQKKSQAPQLRHRLVAKTKLTEVNIKMPEISGVIGGTGYGQGSGLGSPGFVFDMDLFGSNSRGDGTFVGHFYDLKQTKSGGLSEIGELLDQSNGNKGDSSFQESREKYRAALARFLNGWNTGRLDDYFMAPREKFASAFMIPQISADEAPKAFGVQEQVKPREWSALYRGQITAPESGKYRFVGLADDIMVVRVKKSIVIDASLTPISDWRSSDPDDRKYETYEGRKCVIGDWFFLKKGQATPMDVLIGEEPGGYFYCQLYIQKEGVKYPTSSESFTDPDTKKTVTIQRPILPIFKTAELSGKMVEQMNIEAKWATCDGPIFGHSDN